VSRKIVKWAVNASQLSIADCGFPIGFFRKALIGNRQSQIGNRTAHRLPPNGVLTKERLFRI